MKKMFTRNRVGDSCRRQLRQFALIPVFLFFGLKGNAQNLDIRILKSVNNSDVSSGMYKSMRFITNSAPEVSLGLPAVLLVRGLVEHDEATLHKAIYMGESLVITEIFTAGMKYGFNRPRPFVTYPDIVKKSDGGSPSFPSGHTSFAFATATSLSIAWPKWYVIVPSYAYASLVGYSRMYLGVHYPSDVLAGAIVGSGSAYLTYKANQWIHRSKHKQLAVTW